VRWSERNRSYTRDLVLHPSADTSNITLQQASGSQRVHWRAACVHMGDAIRKPGSIAAVFWPLKVPLEACLPHARLVQLCNAAFGSAPADHVKSQHAEEAAKEL